MIVFNVDLDNTMIFSYKHDIGTDKINVEIYQEREISFITNKTYELIKQVQKKVLFVPTTTRTNEQYERIDLKIGIPQYALTCNGGVLLKNGIEDEDWYNESLRFALVAQEELIKAEKILYSDKRRIFELRNIKQLFIFTKCEQPQDVVELLRDKLNTSRVDVFNNGVKIYVVPKGLSKGMAIKRFRKYINANKVIAAGDSEFDLSMLIEADIGIAPKKLVDLYQLPNNVVTISDKMVFSEGALEYIMSNCNI